MSFQERSILDDWGAECRFTIHPSPLTDLYIQWPLDEQQGYHGPMQRIVLELKIQRGSLQPLLQTGLAQTVEYAQRSPSADF